MHEIDLQFSLTSLIDIFLHLDLYLDYVLGALGPWCYVLLFFVIFTETGVVIMPFLPGDSLLFALGALAALGKLEITLLLPLLFTAAVLGDFVNYRVGYWFGPKAFLDKSNKAEKWRWLNRDHLIATQEFYNQHGGKTVIWARFLPIFRTFAPFVAGIAQMNYRQFIQYNLVGGALWISSFLFLGYFFGNLPFVKDSFHWIILAVIAVSFMPVVLQALRLWRRNHQSKKSIKSQ